MDTLGPDTRIQAIQVSKIVLATDVDPWERQFAESDKEWAAFLVYRELSPSQRTLKNCANLLANGEVQQTPRWISIAARNNRWSERVVSYDRWKDANMRMQLNERILRRKIAAADLAEEIYAKISEAVSAIKAVIEITVTDADGKKTKELRSALSATAVSQLGNIARNLERDAFGEPDKDSSGSFHIHTNVLNVADKQLIQQAKVVVDEQEKIIDALPSELIRSTTSDASTNSRSRHADVG